jgi:hypothetical protein
MKLFVKQFSLASCSLPPYVQIFLASFSSNTFSLLSYTIFFCLENFSCVILTTASLCFSVTRSQIISLLLEVPGHCLPLFKFRELFESRYLTSISMSDMYRMKDVCLISEESTGRMVILNPDHRNTPSPIFASAVQVNIVSRFCWNNFRLI